MAVFVGRHIPFRDTHCVKSYVKTLGSRFYVVQTTARSKIIFMAALRSRCGHYIFALWFLSIFFLFFIPRLISAVGDWMSTIGLLRHMVWP